MLKDLFEIDISAVPVLGTAEVRNLGFSLSTGDVETPLTVLDISSEDVFELPYSKGLKVSSRFHNTPSRSTCGYQSEEDHANS
jgi:hypothetical protein